MEKWIELGKSIARLGAPLLGGAIGGPGGAALGSIVASALGGNADDPDDLNRIIGLDPESAVKLKAIESEHKIQMERIILEGTNAHLADRASARSREVEVTRATGKTNSPLYILAGGVVVGIFALAVALFVVEIPLSNQEVAYMLFGSLVASFGMVVSYFFGSSKGSSDKDSVIANGGKK